MSSVIYGVNKAPAWLKAGLEKLETEKKALKRVFVANNGLSAIKFINSMKEFSYQFLGKNIFEFYGMATLEDVEGGYEYCKKLDDFEIVESGPSSTNFGNVDLIKKIALRFDCGCLWPGWGHASENPRLPEALEGTNIVFLGPSFRAMWLLGSKVPSMIMSQGLRIRTPSYFIDDNLYLACKRIINGMFSENLCLKEIEELMKVPIDPQHIKKRLKELKLPILIKMNQSGGGRGIQKISSEEDLNHGIEKAGLGSPFLAVECMEDVRHVEMQVISDRNNNVLVLDGRDCTTQRRYQKVIETSISEIDLGAVRRMKRDAKRLAIEARYTGLATVEFLFNVRTQKYYFLEVNTRIQVEHTVTELLFDVNLPAIQYLLGIGFLISDIKKIFKIRKPSEYVMGVRLNAESSRLNFEPDTGKISVSYSGSRSCMGYFSVYNGRIHEYSETQFGHIFSRAKTRNKCVINLLYALDAISVKYIETPIKDIVAFMKTPQFLENRISTRTFESFVLELHCTKKMKAKRSHDILVISKEPHEKNDSKFSKSKNRNPNPVNKDHVHLLRKSEPNSLSKICFVDSDVNLLDLKDAIPIENTQDAPEPEAPQSLPPYIVVASVIAADKLFSLTKDKSISIRFLFQDLIYTFVAYLASPNNVILEASSSFINVYVSHILPSEVILKYKSTLILEFYKSATSYTVFYKGEKLVALMEFNTSYVLSPKQGKIVSFCCNEGDLVKKDERICEVESMKVTSHILAPFCGKIKFLKGIGCAVAPEEPVCVIESGKKVFKESEDKLPGFEDDGTLTLNLFKGFVIPQELWRVPRDAVLISTFMSSFLGSGGSSSFCYKIFEALEDFLSSSNIDIELAVKVTSNIYEIVLRESLDSGKLYKSIVQCLQSLEAGISSQILGATPATRKIGSGSIPINIQHIDTEYFDKKILLQEHGELIPRRPLFLYFNGERAKVDVHESVYLSPDFWTTLLANMKLKVLRTREEHRDSGDITQVFINIHGGRSTPKELLSSEVIRYVNSSLIDYLVIIHQEERYELCNMRGFLESKLIRGEKLVSYQANLRSIKNLSIQDIAFDKCEVVKERRFAKKNRTMYYKDFLDLVKIYFKERMVECRISEVSMDTMSLSQEKNIISGNKSYEDTKETKSSLEKVEYVYRGRTYKLSMCKTLINSIGIKGFVLNYQKKKVVMIFNDITYKNGSFSILEDIFFYLLTRYCRIRKVPRIFIASNSGARVGVCEDLIDKLELVESRGDCYMALKREHVSERKKDIQRFPKKENHLEKKTMLEPVSFAEKLGVEDVESNHKVFSIFGNTDSGPENLSFSALIAAETAKAQEEVFTLSYVTGMSVGVGAYLMELGGRVIQKRDSPILLTGFKVLNKLLQANIYTSNTEIGGFEVLGSNGVSDLEAYDEFHGISEIFWWLGFYFDSVSSRSSSKNSSRDRHGGSILWTRSRANISENLNEREILEAIMDGSTFKEYQSQWAPNVVVGRGYIQGSPLGIIFPEVDSKITQAPGEPGKEHVHTKWTRNVMFSETAEKISRAIDTFNKEKADILIMANWKGFSGSTESMLRGILQSGSQIIKSLIAFKQRAFVYLPPFGELRGGTYLIFDSKINSNIHIAAHPTAEVGIIQPEGLAEVKMKGFGDREFVKEFCRLHDNVYRMVQGGFIKDFVSIKDLREYIILHKP